VKILEDEDMPTTSELNYKTPAISDFDRPDGRISAESIANSEWDENRTATQRAIVEDGFLRIKMSESQIELVLSVQAAMAKFFAQEDVGKEPYRHVDIDCGWTPSFEEPAYQPGTVASLESFDVIKSLVEGDSESLWPDETGFRSGGEKTWRELNKLGGQVLRLLAHSTGIGEDFLADACHSRELNTLRLLHYPPQFEVPAAHEVGIAAHTDFECITLLYQSSPGLEIRKPDGTWTRLPAEPDTLIVLFDDMLERWTNGEIQATGHRVSRSDRQRFSIVMFIAADKGLQVAPLEHFVSAERPAKYASSEQETHIDQQIARAEKLRVIAGVGKPTSGILSASEENWKKR
jgi:isopenicillin N synthase-like dioxygenase